ncbi:MAG: DUF1592 domain-containing protein [Verrucomicrobiae bacterium]|nr:DUF1592 domain-containing protein [Verrucomicrobiae bacterium]
MMAAAKCHRLSALLAGAAAVLAGPVRAADPDPKPGAAADPGAVPAFLEKYCVECHGAEKRKGDRRFDALKFPAATADELIDLQDVIDQLTLGDMPPKKAAQPSDAEKVALIGAVTGNIAALRESLASTGAQTVLRRLNRREYLNTVGDLFALNMGAFDPTDRFPRDQIAANMDNTGDALAMSGYLLDRHLDAADRVVEKALGPDERPAAREWRFDGDFQQQQELSYPHRKVFNHRYLCLYEVRNTVHHEGGYGPVHGFEQGAPADGLYEIRVLAQALNRRHPYDPKIFGMDPETPFRLGIVPGDAAVGPLHHPQPLEPELAEVTLGDGEPEWHTMKIWLDAGHTPRFVFPNGAANSRGTWVRLLEIVRPTLPEAVRDKKGIYEARPLVMQYGKVPHIRIHEVRIRGPLHDEWPTPGRRAVLGDGPYDPSRARELLRRFADRAYRRPATGEEVDRLMAVVERREGEGRAPFDGFKDALKAALCSPAFLYLSEPGRADDQPALGAHDLAARLSYFLTATTPDEPLRALADSGEIRKPETLRAEARRLLASPRSEAFVEGFLDSWLNLRALGDMPPDRDAFEAYYAGELQDAMKTETRMFMRHLLDTDGGVADFLDADYTFVNRPLARLYGLDTPFEAGTGHLFRRVALKDPRRGGLLGQGSVLTVSANGIETSPVIRGIWLLENILGTPPPPPPDDVPPIDPDVRGAKSIRDILTKHRESATCHDCHQKIDPLGFALENYDPIGAWRTHYTQGKKRGPVIDASGELPGGAAFRDAAGLKKILVERRDLFTKMLAERLLVYATGRRMEVLDRPEIDRVAANGHGLRTLIEEVVASRVFRNR